MKLNPLEVKVAGKAINYNPSNFCFNYPPKVRAFYFETIYTAELLNHFDKTKMDVQAYFPKHNYQGYDVDDIEDPVMFTCIDPNFTARSRDDVIIDFDYKVVNLLNLPAFKLQDGEEKPLLPKDSYDIFNKIIVYGLICDRRKPND